MKTFYSLLIILFFFSSAAIAQTWNGTVSNSWDNALNWTPNVVPGTSSNVTINNVGFSPKLFSNASASTIAVNPGVVLDFNGFSMTLTSTTSGNKSFNGVTFTNSNVATDIILNLNTGTSGYSATISGCTINDKITFNLTGSDAYFEGSSANQFNGDVIYNVNGNMIIYLSYGAPSVYAGNLNITRTIAGTSSLFGNGCSIAGNFNYQNTVGGSNAIGTASFASSVTGTCTINVSYPSPAAFTMFRLKNQTSGGSINIQNSLGLNIQNDTIKVTSFIVQGYTGNAYTYLYSNKIDGNITFSDDVTYTTGYYTDVRNNTITGNSSFTIKGSNTFYEANIGLTGGVYNGNTVYNLNGSGNLYLSQGDKSTYNGNLTISRTAAGYTRAFNFGSIINGNFSYNNSSSGDVDFGSLSNSTAVSGTVNMNVNLTSIGGFSMYRLNNQTPGGKINLQNTKGFDIRNDSLKVDSLNVISYRGSAYAYFTNNQLNGHLTIADSVSYSGGYSTYLQNNTVTGNSIFNVYGPNSFYEANGAGSANQFNGNLTINIFGTSSVYTSHSEKSTITGNFIVNRTGNGYTRLFTNGATISGNFSFTKNSSGASDLGVLSSKTSIAGTINMNVTQTTADDFSMHRIQNLTNGGSILVQNTKAPSVQQDSLLEVSIGFTGYAGNTYAYFYDNQITGNMTILNSPAYGGGYASYIRNNVITGNTICTNQGSNTFFEADAGASANIFNGNVTFNCDGSGALYISHGLKSTFNGNLTINRTAAGFTKAFNFGATINGNFVYTKNTTGASEFGNISRKTSITGTVNMTVTQSAADNMELFWVVNSTNGGAINIQNTKAPTIQKDSLLLTAFSVLNYSGGAYAYFYDNQITGNVTIQSDPTYVGGYATYIRNNTINGNTICTNQGTNTFNEADGIGAPNIFNGNVTFNCDGSGALYISYGAKSTYNGNLIINRTVGGITKAFNFGALVNGNFSYTKNAAGTSEFGNLSRQTSISGMINMNILQTNADPFEMYWLVNGTPGGSISVQGSKAFDCRNDSIKIAGMSITGYSGGTYAYLIDNNIEGDVTIADSNAYGGGYYTDLRNNTISGNMNATNNGTNQFYDGSGANYGNTYLGNVTYKRNGAAMNIGTVDTNSYAGNLVFNNSAALPINSELIKFIGSNNTNIDQLGTGNINLQKLIINKTGTARVTLNKPVIVSTSCNFNTGYISSTSANPLIFLDNINHTGTSDNSHVVGYVTKVGNDAFTFPLGNGIGYHPLAITAPTAVTDSFQAGIILKHPSDDGYNVNSKDAALLQIAPYHYWTLNQISGANSETVSLGWSIPCANTVVASLPGMAVARWNGTQWNNLGNSGTTGTTSLGTVSMTGTTPNYGVFALATTSASNSWQITSVSASASTVCQGVSTTLTGAGAATYNWQPGNLSGTSVVVTPLSTTTYTITGTSATGCITTATKTITVNPLPTTSTTVSVNPICFGTSTTITGSGANNGYVWQPGGATTTAITVSPAATTTYTVTGTNNFGCTLTATRTITVNPLPLVGTTVTNAAICIGASTSITGTNAVTYTWQPGSLSGTTITVTPISTTTYTVTGTNANGCVNTATRTITVNPLPTVSTTVTNASICIGASTNITGTNAVTYAWQPGSLSGTTITVTPVSTTTYTVTGTNANGCVNTATRTITVNPLPTVGTTVTNATICAGTSTTMSGTGASSYTWQPGSLSGTTVTVTPVSTTTYTVTGTNANGCVNTATRTITVNPLPTIGTTVTNATVCAGTSTTMSGTGALSYTWQPGSLSGTTVTVTPASTTTYTVTGTNANGCTNTVLRTITVNPLPSVGTTVTLATVCNGSATSITGTGANSYSWQPGSLSGATITVNPFVTATYTVTGTSAAGCSATAQRTITVTNCTTTLNLKFFIEGYSTGTGTMSPALFNQGVTLNTSAVDSVVVKLRNTTFPYSVVATTNAILNTNGNATFVFTPYVSGNYYVSVYNRNAIQTWSSAGVSVGATPVSYDFSNAITKAYGNNMKLVSTSPNVYGFYSGDVNQDENVDAIDLTIVEIGINNFLFGYQASDLNGDGNVDLADSGPVENNLSSFIFSAHP